MSKHKQKKLNLFKKFSQNLEWVKEHPSIRFEPNFQNGYLCPLCFNAFLEGDLDDSLPNHLTGEDIPPKKLGGSVKALSCKDCNSKSGHNLDIHLLNRLMELDAKMFLPNSKSRTTFELNGNKVNGTIGVDENGIMVVDVQSKISNPIQSKKFRDQLILPQTFECPFFDFDKSLEPIQLTKTFTFQLKNKSNERRMEIALLRIAYLTAFSTLGNGFLINGSLFKVREQIMNPDKDILPKTFWIKYDFPEEYLGINIIKSPKELRCFLIIFNLITKSKVRRCGIALPGPSDPGLKIYDNIDNILCKGDGTKFESIDIEHLGDTDWLAEKKLAFASHIYWQELTKEETGTQAHS